MKGCPTSSSKRCGSASRWSPPPPPGRPRWSRTTRPASSSRSGTPPALAQAIRRVISEPELAARLGEAGRARVEAEFGVDRMVARFAELYESLAIAKGVGREAPRLAR